jgi:hypothetical protein
VADGAEAAPCHHQALQGHVDHVDLGSHGELARWTLKLMPLRPGLLKSMAGLVAVGPQTGDLLTLGAIVVAAPHGVGFPWLAAGFDGGKLAPQMCSSNPLASRLPGALGVCIERLESGESHRRVVAPRRRARLAMTVHPQEAL